MQQPDDPDICFYTCWSGNLAVSATVPGEAFGVSSLGVFRVKIMPRPAHHRPEARRLTDLTLCVQDSGAKSAVLQAISVLLRLPFNKTDMVTTIVATLPDLWMVVDPHDYHLVQQSCGLVFLLALVSHFTGIAVNEGVAVSAVVS